MSIRQRRPLWSTMKWKHLYWERAEAICWANARRDKKCECNFLHTTHSFPRPLGLFFQSRFFYLNWNGVKSVTELFHDYSWFSLCITCLISPSTPDFHCCCLPLFIYLYPYLNWISFIQVGPWNHHCVTLIHLDWIGIGILSVIWLVC